MQRSLPYPFVILTVLLFGALLAACGGGGDNNGGGFPLQDDDNDNGAADGPNTAGDDDGEGDNGGDSSNGGGSGEGFGEPQLTADPGQAWAEVDGERLEYEVAGSLFFICDISSDQVQASFQTSDGNDLMLTGSRQGDDWFGRVTFWRNVDGTRLQYSSDLFTDADARVGLSDTAIDFEGTVSRIEGTDILDAEDREARVAINCDVGPPPVAEIDGQSFEFPFSGSQSVECEVSDDGFRIDVGPTIDGNSIEFNGRTEGGNFLGSVSVRTGSVTYISTIPGDREGLEVDGQTIRYSGTFENRTANEEVEGSAEVTCP